VFKVLCRSRTNKNLKLETHHELLHAHGKGGGVEQDLPVLGQEADDILDEHHEVLRQQLVGLRGNGGSLMGSTFVKI